jgi:hypothetical protein
MYFFMESHCPLLCVTVSPRSPCTVAAALAESILQLFISEGCALTHFSHAANGTASKKVNYRKLLAVKLKELYSSVLTAEVDAKCSSWLESAHSGLAEWQITMMVGSESDVALLPLVATHDIAAAAGLVSWVPFHGRAAPLRSGKSGDGGGADDEQSGAESRPTLLNSNSRRRSKRKRRLSDNPVLGNTSARSLSDLHPSPETKDYALEVLDALEMMAHVSAGRLGPGLCSTVLSNTAELLVVCLCDGEYAILATLQAVSTLSAANNTSLCSWLTACFPVWRQYCLFARDHKLPMFVH